MFCGQIIPKGIGKLIVKKDGSIVTICSSKCEKNMFKLKRSPRKQKWVSKMKGPVVVEAAPDEKEKVVLKVSEKKRKK